MGAREYENERQRKWKCHPSGINKRRKRDNGKERNIEKGIEWNACELEKTEQETKSRRKSGVGVREDLNLDMEIRREQLPPSLRRYI